ncbi:MAG TPA: SusC/RagA family TonB-linked outer membrane protein, partial [Bacteroidales bacterium]|nr:SusC/RagA family TonB-linked outer membrane protein [Bacteroidales bacterium]
MRLTLILMVVSLMQVYATGYTQSVKISLTLKNVSLKQALKEIEKQSDYTFVYSDSKIDVNKKVDINVKDCALIDVLDQLIANSEIRYTSVDNHIVLTGKKNFVYRLPSITHEAVLNREVVELEAINPIRNIFIQQVSVTGTVTSAVDGSALPGVNIVVKGTTIGTTSDMTGSFTLNVPDPNATLVFTFIGYQSQEITLAGQKNITVSMTEETQELQEIVVVGYGTQMKKDITGAVSTIKTKELLSSTGSSAAQQLQGKAAGVYVGQSGSPGSPTMVRIRGINTVNENGPLFVIDGVSTRNQNLSTLNPNDIESMQILKDASAAAIYGAQAANGVVLITTKRGTKGKPVITYDGYYGIQKTTRQYDVLNSRDRLDLEWKAKANALSIRGVAGLPSHIQFGTGATPVIPNYLTWKGAKGAQNIDPGIYNYADSVITEFGDTDWWDEVDRVAPMQNHQLGLSGGSDKGQYTMSANYFDQQGTIIETYYKRFQVRANSSYDVRPWLRFGENLTYAYTKDNGLNAEATEETIYSWTYRASPFVPVYDIGGHYAGSKIAGTGNWQNPVAVQKRNKDNYWTNSRIFGNLYGEVDLFKKLKYRNSFGIDYTNNYSYRMAKKNLEFSETRGTNNLEEVSGFNFRWVWTNTLSYNLANDLHSLNLLVGTEAIRDGIGRSMTSRRYGYLFEDDTNTWTLDLGTNDNQRTNSSSYKGEFALFGIFARADYALKNKYLLTAIVRRDGVSRFSENNRYGTFPSVSLGWRISDESFMEGTKSWLYDMKIRAGYGLTGNSEVPRATNFAYEYTLDPKLTNYDLGGTNNSSYTGYRLGKYGNEDTKWESTNMTNVGLDMSFLNGKVSASIDGYYKKTSDMLVEASYSGLAGEADKPYINYGDIENKGFDISLNYRDQKGDFSWDINANVSHYKNKILKL